MTTAAWMIFTFVLGLLAGIAIGGRRDERTAQPDEGEVLAAKLNQVLQGTSPQSIETMRRILSKPISTVSVRTAIVYHDDESEIEERRRRA